MKCNRDRFGTQAEYEECLAERRDKRRGVNGEAARLSAALAATDEHDETDEQD